MNARIMRDVAGPLAQSPARIEFAGFWRRWAAYVVDSIVLAVAGFLVGIVLSSAPPAVLSPSSQSGVDYSGLWGVVSAVIRLGVPALYFVCAYSSGGQTIGKAALGIKVVSIDGSPLTLAKGILRAVGYIPSTLVLGLGFLWSITDSEKQTWHDKIAGTCVVHTYVPREALLGRIDPVVARGRQRHSWVVMAIFMSLVGIAFGWAIFAGVSEIGEMGPWPDRNASPERVAAVDLQHLGLRLAQVKDARSSDDWSKGQYKVGAVGVYAAGQLEVVAITALQYANTATAANEFGSVVEWAKQSCRWSTNANWINSGVIRCGFRGGHNRIFWSGDWILDIIALDGGQLPAQELADQVRDAVAGHWKQARESQR